MGSFTVDPERVALAAREIADLSAGLESSAEGVARALRLVAAACGDELLEGAASSAGRQWGCGLADVGESARAVARATEFAAQAYQLVEARARGGFTPGPGGPP
ncbi:MAG: hypothetical protein M3424_07700 [Actinomycetota bacterium]|jgi:hypothetical protein|nr:hypothetical protein [Actinomycetota bacterium]MDQ3527746.1 hypothetical protein [Actinomycetota bacterium]